MKPDESRHAKESQSLILEHLLHRCHYDDLQTTVLCLLQQLITSCLHVDVCVCVCVNDVNAYLAAAVDHVKWPNCEPHRRRGTETLGVRAPTVVSNTQQNKLFRLHLKKDFFLLLLLLS